MIGSNKPKLIIFDLQIIIMSQCAFNYNKSLCVNSINTQLFDVMVF